MSFIFHQIAGWNRADKKTKTIVSRGFTLIEVMVSTVISLILVGVVFYLISTTAGIWKKSSSKVQSYQEIRAAFETMTRKLSQASLNTYWDYDYDSSGNPLRYKRQSELHFISGAASLLTSAIVPTRPTHAVFFQAPLGFAGGDYAVSTKLLNASGFFIEFDSDELDRPAFLPSTVPPRHRYRLKEFWQPSEQMLVYSFSSGKPDWPASTPPTGIGNNWFAPMLANGDPVTRTLAENVIALIILPRLSEKEDFYGTALAPDYGYNSRLSFSYQGKDKNGSPIPGSSGDIKHQLPPLVQLIIVAMDEPSAQRLAAQNGSNAPDVGLTGLFEDSTKLEEDLEVLEDHLAGEQIGYRVFSTLVQIQGAKWSAD